VATDAQGEARVALKDSRALILVLSRDFAPHQKVVELKDPLAPIEIDLDRGVVRLVRVVGRDQRPVPETPVFFNTMPSVHGFHVLKLKEQPAIGITDADGFLTWQHAPRGLVFVGVPNVTGTLGQFGWDCGKDAVQEMMIRAE
jgi:hypothetical protein